jgi:peptidyl-prolyl cis-trans isomerase A (cyclophilin A)
MKRILVLAGMMAGLVGAAAAQEGAPLPAGPPAQAQFVGPEVTLETSMGDIVVTLDTVGAPKTATQFLGLVKDGHYDGAAFYRVEPGFLIQLGDPDAKLEYRAPKRPPVPLETERNRHVRGAVAMAHADDPDSGQSTFYIDLADNQHLNATEGAAPNTTGYAVFGHVTAGMDVAEAIAGVDVAPEGGPFPGKLPKAPVVVNRAVVTKE